MWNVKPEKYILNFFYTYVYDSKTEIKTEHVYKVKNISQKGKTLKSQLVANNITSLHSEP